MWIEGHQNGLGMAGKAGAYLLIGRVGGEPAAEARRREPDARHAPENALGAPEIAEPEHGLHHALGRGGFQWPLEDVVTRRRGDRHGAARQRLARLRQVQLVIEHARKEEHRLLREGETAKAAAGTMAKKVEQEGKSEKHREARGQQDVDHDRIP